VDLSSLASLGKVAGLGGIAIGLVVLLVRPIIDRVSCRQTTLTKAAPLIALFLGVGLAVARLNDAIAFNDTTVTAESGGIAAGGDIKNNTINELDLTNLPEFVNAFSNKAECQQRIAE
jgi:hypothetical protein